MTFITSPIYHSASEKDSFKQIEKFGKLKDTQGVVLNVILGNKSTKQNCPCFFFSFFIFWLLNRTSCYSWANLAVILCAPVGWMTKKKSRLMANSSLITLSPFFSAKLTFQKWCQRQWRQLDVSKTILRRLRQRQSLRNEN